jgi:hypothetical protein
LVTWWASQLRVGTPTMEAAQAAWGNRRCGRRGDRRGGLRRLLGEGKEKEAGLSLTFPQEFDFAVPPPGFSRSLYRWRKRQWWAGCCVAGPPGMRGWSFAESGTCSDWQTGCGYLRARLGCSIMSTKKCSEKLNVGNWAVDYLWVSGSWPDSSQWSMFLVSFYIKTTCRLSFYDNIIILLAP